MLIVNLITAFRVSLFEQFLGTSSAALGSADAVVEWVVTAGFEEKAFCLFALLFGVGLAIQHDRLARAGRPLYWLARRLVVLLALGLTHLLLVWNGDILAEYALAGLVVLPLLRLPARGLLLAALCFLALYAIGPALYSVPWPSAAGLQAHVALANQVYATGSFAEIRNFSLAELPLILSLHLSVFPRTLGLFLLGVFLWRAGILRAAHSFADEMFVAAVIGITAGAAMSVVLLALGYGAALVALAQLPAMRQVFSIFAPMGRMAFTNYVAQSIVFGLVFFGYGLGQFGQIGAATGFAIGVAVYAAQLVLSKWWLHRYRFGPIEWLWRTLMYGAAQPMVRTSS